MKNSILKDRCGQKKSLKKVFIVPAILTLLLVFKFSTPAFSQDDIQLLNGTHIQGKVEEVDVTKIKYREASNPDGPVHDVLKSDVATVTYANGSSDTYNQGGAPASAATTSDDVPAPAKEAPPALPVYDQPACPVEGYIWTPGYWAWGFAGYYWVPGVWVAAPRPGYLWTPCYWGLVNGVYVYHEGYWGEHIGYYGGVSYGYGYGGHGYDGGRWEGGAFRYNTAVSHVDVTVVHTTYIDNTVVHNKTVVNRSSFNGEGGIKDEPTARERSTMNENHITATKDQQSHVEAAKNDKTQYASTNGGKPAVTAMNKPNGKHFSNDGHIAMPHPNSQPQAQRAGGTAHSGGATQQQRNVSGTQRMSSAKTQQQKTGNTQQKSLARTTPQRAGYGKQISKTGTSTPARPSVANQQRNKAMPVRTPAQTYRPKTGKS